MDDFEWDLVNHYYSEDDKTYHNIYFNKKYELYKCEVMDEEWISVDYVFKNGPLIVFKSTEDLIRHMKKEHML